MSFAIGEGGAMEKAHTQDCIKCKLKFNGVLSICSSRLQMLNAFCQIHTKSPVFVVDYPIWELLTGNSNFKVIMCNMFVGSMSRSNMMPRSLCTVGGGSMKADSWTFLQITHNQFWFKGNWSEKSIWVFAVQLEWSSIRSKSYLFQTAIVASPSYRIK